MIEIQSSGECEPAALLQCDSVNKKSVWSREPVNTISRHRPNHNLKHYRAGDGMLTSTPSVLRLQRIVVGKVSPELTPFLRQSFNFVALSEHTMIW